jgi:hypothetical protein
LLVVALIATSGTATADDLADQAEPVLAQVDVKSLSTTSDVARFAEVIKCSTIEGRYFCTELGFIGHEPGTKSWAAYVDRMLKAQVGNSGDMSYAALLERLESTPAIELNERQVNQFEQAKDAIGREILLDLIHGHKAIPAGFFDQYPSLGIDDKSATADALRAAAVDRSGKDIIQHLTEYGALGGVDLDPYGEEPVAAKSIPAYRYIIYAYYDEQLKSYYCGPATMNSIDWADDGWENGQYFWAGPNYLNTEAQGATAAADMVYGINMWTHWDTSSHGGSYYLESVEFRDQEWFVDAHKLRIGAFFAPVIEHVVLHVQYFPYLSRDHGGHFQTGRGYSENSDTIAIFEPLDERDFGSGNHTGMHQYVPYSNMWGATNNHPHQNFGV